MNTLSLSSQEIQRNTEKAIDKIFSSVFGESATAVGGVFTTTDAVQRYVFYGDNRFHDVILKPILIKALNKSESLAGGSAEKCLIFSLNMLKILNIQKLAGSSHREAFEKMKLSTDLAIEVISKNGKRAERDDVSRLISSQIKNKTLQNIINDVIHIADFSSQIFIEKSVSQRTVIESKTGFGFNINTDSECLMGVPWKRSNVRCIVIDGIIESVGEIHHLLQKASEDKLPYVMFVRGLSDEVKHTIYLNLARKTIDLVPVCVGFDEKSINILNDIAICTDSDLISSHKGDLISTACNDDRMSVIHHISITEKNVQLSHNPGESKLKAHLTFLKKKREDAQNSNVRDLFDMRIRSLSSGKTIVKVGHDLRFHENSMEKLDKFFRTLSVAIQFGVVNPTHLTYPDRWIKDLILETFSSEDLVPTASLCAALKIAFSAASSIASVNYALLEDI